MCRLWNIAGQDAKIYFVEKTSLAYAAYPQHLPEKKENLSPYRPKRGEKKTVKYGNRISPIHDDKQIVRKAVKGRGSIGIGLKFTHFWTRPILNSSFAVDKLMAKLSHQRSFMLTFSCIESN